MIQDDDWKTMEEETLLYQQLNPNRWHNTFVQLQHLDVNHRVTGRESTQPREELDEWNFFT